MTLIGIRGTLTLPGDCNIFAIHLASLVISSYLHTVSYTPTDQKYILIYIFFFSFDKTPRIIQIYANQYFVKFPFHVTSLTVLEKSLHAVFIQASFVAKGHFNRWYGSFTMESYIEE